MSAKLKPKAGQIQHIALNKRIATLEDEIKALKAKQKETKSSGIYQILQEQIDDKYNKIDKAYWQLKDYYSVCLDYEISPAVNAEMVEWYLDKIHPESDYLPYIATMLKYGTGANEYYRRMMDMDAYRKKVLNLLSLEMNTYISPASFAHSVSSSQRNIPYGGEAPVSNSSNITYKGGTKETITGTQAIVIDLDYRDTMYSGVLAEDFYEELKDRGAFDKFGEPSFCVVSSEGAGLQMTYLLDKPYLTYFNDRRIARYEITVRSLIKHFEEYGADRACSDMGHLFRVPCSFNIRTGTWGFILHWEKLKDDDYEVERYSFEALEAALGLSMDFKKQDRPTATPVRKKPQKAAQKPTGSTGGFYTLSLNRCHDLEHLIRIRGAEIEGLRNPLLFIYANQYAVIQKDEEEIFKALSKINAMFSTQKEDKELMYIAKRTSQKIYHYKDITICNSLNITDDEKAQLQVLGHTQEKKDYMKNYLSKRRRTETGELKSKVSKQERNKQIKALKEQGLTNKQISEKLNVSIRTIQYVINRKEAA